MKVCKIKRNRLVSQKLSAERLLFSNQEKRTPLPEIQTPKCSFKIPKLKNLKFHRGKKSVNDLDQKVGEDVECPKGLSNSLCMNSDKINPRAKLSANLCKFAKNPKMKRKKMHVSGMYCFSKSSRKSDNPFNALRKDKVKLLLERLTGGKPNETQTGTLNSAYDQSLQQTGSEVPSVTQIRETPMKRKKKSKNYSCVDSNLEYEIYDISIFNNSESKVKQTKSRKSSLKKNLYQSESYKVSPRRKTHHDRRIFNRFKRTNRKQKVETLNPSTDRKVNFSEEFSIQDILFQ